jgi:hypothetical protein
MFNSINKDKYGLKGKWCRVFYWVNKMTFIGSIKWLLLGRPGKQEKQSKVSPLLSLSNWPKYCIENILRTLTNVTQRLKPEITPHEVKVISSNLPSPNLDEYVIKKKKKMKIFPFSHSHLSIDVNSYNPTSWSFCW